MTYSTSFEGIEFQKQRRTAGGLLHRLTTKYEQRLRDQYDPATGERKLLLKWGKADEPCFNLDFRPDSPLCCKCGQRHGIPKGRNFGVWKDDRVPLGYANLNLDTPTASAKRTLTK